MSSSWAEAVGADVRRRMKRQKMSTRALATAAGIPYSTLRRRLDHPSTIQLGELEAISRVLDAPTYHKPPTA